MDVWRESNACENNKAFPAWHKAHDIRSSAARPVEPVEVNKETFHSGRGQFYAKLAADMSCHESKFCRKIQLDIDYYFYCKSHGMLTKRPPTSQEIPRQKFCLMRSCKGPLGCSGSFLMRRTLNRTRTATARTTGGSASRSNRSLYQSTPSFPTISSFLTSSPTRSRHALVFIPQEPCGPH